MHGVHGGTDALYDTAQVTVKGKDLGTCYSAAYTNRLEQQHFTISEMAADWHELTIFTLSGGARGAVFRDTGGGAVPYISCCTCSEVFKF